MIHSIAVKSDGSYGFSEGVWASVPVRTTGNGTYEVLRDMPHSAFAKEKLKLTNEELVGERDTVADLLS